MLRELKVENLALIESLHLSFDRADDASLVVLTGETGAGKSIMMRAIDLLSGGRGSADWVRSGAETCTVEALFDVGEHFADVHELLRDGGFDDSDQVLFKRVINTEGRSRFYINGSMATARLVSEISFRLFSIASQHDHQRLLQPALHLDFLDILGDHQKQREQVRSCHEAWRVAQQELARLHEQNREREQRRDFLAYQIREIGDIAPEPDEDERLGIERKRLKNGETLIRLSRECHELLEESISENLAVVRKNMEQLRQLDPDVETLADELSSYAYLAEDFSARLRDYFDTLDDDPARLDAISARLDKLQGLKRKYGETLTDVLNYLAGARLELEALDNLDQQIEAQRNKTERLERQVLDCAEQLSTARQKTAAAMEQAMARELLSLSFEQPTIEVRFQPVEDKLAQMRAVGFDRVEFFFAANPGEPSRPLARVASGGELSRLMLAFKCLLARKDMVETVIFDEVDAGIGGQAAESVARKIRELAGHHQVICITHLPQIAARGTHHFLVEKGMSGGRTITSVAMLSEQQRVEELARMLAGESPSVQTEAWARELLAKGKRAA
ncbi:MAG: DNA repair protein RecN [Desulfofustis sp.]|jgi:DNA repair protein RecN (Recombination protein N)|nr:DNA repair protein RecN [Desulfofustis sp.]